MYITGSLWPLLLFVTLSLFSYVGGLSEIATKVWVKGVGFGIGATMACALAFALTPWLAIAFLGFSYLIARWRNREALKRFHEWTGQLETEDRIPPEWTKTGKHA